MNPLRSLRFIALACLGLAAAEAALAGDGVLELNGACVNSGCFSGDSPGFPVEITQPGSYRLTSNIEINQNTTAVDISADDVTLDLNGFAIRGPTTCQTTSPPSCSNTGIGTGISSTGTSTTVRNGSVSGAGASCIALNAPNARVSDVSISECGANGLYINRGLVESVTVRAVASTGIGTSPAAAAAYVRDSLVRSADYGIIADACDNVWVRSAASAATSCTSTD